MQELVFPCGREKSLQVEALLESANFILDYLFVFGGGRLRRQWHPGVTLIFEYLKQLAEFFELSLARKMLLEPDMALMVCMSTFCFVSSSFPVKLTQLPYEIIK